MVLQVPKVWAEAGDEAKVRPEEQQAPLPVSLETAAECIVVLVMTTRAFLEVGYA
jgi:hypothetical protein